MSNRSEKRRNYSVIHVNLKRCEKPIAPWNTKKTATRHCSIMYTSVRHLAISHLQLWFWRLFHQQISQCSTQSPYILISRRADIFWILFCFNCQLHTPTIYIYIYEKIRIECANSEVNAAKNVCLIETRIHTFRLKRFWSNRLHSKMQTVGLNETPKNCHIKISMTLQWESMCEKTFSIALYLIGYGFWTIASSITLQECKQTKHVHGSPQMIMSVINT